MAMAVIDQLETIQIEQGQPMFLARLLRVQTCIQFLEKRPPVGQVRQAVGEGLMA